MAVSFSMQYSGDLNTEQSNNGNINVSLQFKFLVCESCPLLTL